MPLPDLPSFESWCTAGDKLIGTYLFDAHTGTHWRVAEKTPAGAFIVRQGKTVRHHTRAQMENWLGTKGTLSNKTRGPLEDEWRTECIEPRIEAQNQLQEEELRARVAERRRAEELKTAKEKRLKAERTAQEERIREFISLCEEAKATELAKSIMLRIPLPSREDRELSNLWLDGNISPGKRLMMLSARLAECALRDELTARGHSVIDTSVKQLTEPSSTEWKSHDLLVDNVPWDVKNARESQHNAQAYTSYCVPRFKQDRTGTDVHIAGVLSPYLFKDELESGKHKARWLGTVTHGRLRELEESFRDPSVIEELVLQSHATSHLPPWLFEYPHRDYEVRERALAQLDAGPTPSQKDCTALGFSYEAALLARGSSGTTLASDSRNLGHDFPKRLRENVNRLGLSLGVLYLTTLVEFLKAVRTGAQHISWDDTLMRRMLYPTPDRAWPLFVYDPLHSIDNALCCFEDLSHANDLAAFRIFAMPNPNIVRGRQSVGHRWTTLLAYCGGWIEEGRPCMKTPLVFGKHKSCACGHLVCPECEFCMTGCPERT